MLANNNKFKQLFVFTLLLGASILSHATDKGLFWKLESPSGITSYLFGTIHTDDNRVADLSANVLDAIKKTDTFLMEAEPSQDNTSLMLTDGNVAELLTSDEFDQVRELADFHVMHMGAVMKMKPWLLAVIFDLPKPQTEFSQDNLLMAKSIDFGKDVKGLETSKEHFSIMDNFSINEQVVMLRAVLKRTPEQKEADFERLLAAYLLGDSDKLTALDEQITGGMLPVSIWSKMRKSLLDDRNLTMAKRAIPLALEKPVFVAVGASHLAGDNGLISAFKKAGFKLTAVAK